MRRLVFMCVLVGALAGCSSGSSTAGSTTSSSTTAGASTAPTGTSTNAAKPKSSATPSKPKVSATPHKVIIGGATTFCGAFKELNSVKASDGAATASAVYQAAAADMRKYAPAAIKSAALSYATVIDEAGKALKTGTMPTTSVGKPTDLATVTVWVSKNCPKK